MVGSNTLDTVHFKVDLLARAKLSDQNVWVDRLDSILSSEELLLTSDRVESDVSGVNMRILIQLAGVILRGVSVGVLGTFNIQSQDDGVVIGWIATLGIILRGLLEPTHPVNTIHGTLQWNQTQSLGEHFILDDGGVIVNEDELDGNARHFSHYDTTEGICDRCIYADVSARRK